MQKMLLALFLFVAAGPLIGHPGQTAPDDCHCDTRGSNTGSFNAQEEYLANEEQFIRDIESNPIGNGAVWLEQTEFTDRSNWDKVMLVFGYYDDHLNCLIIKEAMKKAQAQLDYRCNPAR